MADSSVEEEFLTNDYYSLLNVSREASTDEINNAFRTLSKIYHPDKHVSFAKKRMAEMMFTKIKKAHEVLSDKHKRTIYDIYGESGLQTEGMELISKMKSPAEIISEYEQIQKEREERRLNQRTNPKGTVSVVINARDIFDYHETEEDAEYEKDVNVEISSIHVFQSVECPLTQKDSVLLGANLSTKNGIGDGKFVTTWRRLNSNVAWTEFEVAAGSNISCRAKGFRQLSRRCYGTVMGVLQTSSRGIRPSLISMLVYQFDQCIQGRMTWNAGYPSSLSSVIMYGNERNQFMLTLQLGFSSTFLSASASHNFLEEKGKVRGAVKLGTLGIIGEYGFERKISHFSILGATMVVGLPVGVMLKIKLLRGNQAFYFPIHLSDNVSPSAVFYGTVIPVLVYFFVKKIIVNPFLRLQKESDIEKKQQENAEKLEQTKKEAQMAVALMKETVDRIIEIEEKRNGLLIINGLYGLIFQENVLLRKDEHCINVTIPLQALVKDSKLILHNNSSKSCLPGFYDACIGEEKTLYVKYRFRNQIHEVTIKDNEPVRLPQQRHLVSSEDKTTQ